MANTEIHDKFLQHVEYRCALVSEAVYQHGEDVAVPSLPDFTNGNLQKDALQRLAHSASPDKVEGVLEKYGLLDATEEQIDDVFDGDYVPLFKKDSGYFQTKLFFDSHSDRFVLAFAGTNPLRITDLESNLRQFFGRSAEHYEWGMDIARHVAPKYHDRIVVTGHSLGGGIATVAALAGGFESFVFNPPCIHDNTLERIDPLQRYRAEKYVRRFVVFGDVLDIVNKVLGINHHRIGEKNQLYGSFTLPYSSIFSVSALFKKMIPGVGPVLAFASPVIEKMVRLHRMEEVLYGLRQHLS